MKFAFPRGVVFRSRIGVLAVALLPRLAAAQEPVGGSAAAAASAAGAVYAPPTAVERVTWVVQGTASLPVVGLNALDAAWQTKSRWPREWGGDARGFGRRFADAEATGTVESVIEAGVGALWGEDPRYRRSGQHAIWPRVRYALAAAVLAPRPDGHLAPAWGRMTAIVAGAEIENRWLPPSARTPGQTAWRIGDTVLGRGISNVWDEFWPDVRRWLPERVR